VQREPLDRLVGDYLAKESELARRGSQIAQSGTDVAIVFVDLADSTAIKHELPPEKWLGYV